MNELTKIKGIPAALRQDFDIIKKLQQKQKELEDRVSQSRSDTSEFQSGDDRYEVQKFRSHPNRILSPKNEVEGEKFTSFSNTHVEMSSFYEERKTKTNSIRKKLHEKLSLTNSNNDFDMNSHLELIGDNCYNSVKSYPTLNQYCTENSGPESPPYKKESNMNIASKVNLSNKSSVTKPNKLIKQKSSKNSSVQSSHRSHLGTGLLEMKFRTIVDKCLQAFGDIRTSIEKGISLPDGDEDAARRLIRVKEFSNRFSRNYLYPLDIQLKELREAERKEPMKHSNQFKQKLLSSYQTILYGLQAYQTHIPTSMGNCASDKLNILLGNVLDICRIHNDILLEVDIVSGFSVVIETFKMNAELTQEKIKDAFCDNRAKSADSVLRSNDTKLSLAQYGGPNVKKTKSKTTKNFMEKRLSMYSATASFRKDPMWRMAVDTLAKKKFNVKSKYKTATYKHRPPVQKELEVTPLPTNNIKILAKKSSSILKNTPIVTPKNEDNIETMVEMVSGNSRSGTAVESGREEEKKDQVQNDLVIKLLQLVLNSKNETENNNVRSNELFELMDKIKEEGNGEALQNILEGLKQNKKKGKCEEQLILNIVQSRTGTAEKEKKRKEPKVTSVTGDKNARLICITDENSIIESDHESTNKKPATVYSSQTETYFDNNGRKDEGKVVTKTKSGSIVRISRLPKCGKPLQILPKDFALNVIQYKLEFYKHCKNNPMYRKTSNCQPCDLMNSVSDELLNQCLLEVAREIEINDVIDTIYQAELEL